MNQKKGTERIYAKQKGERKLFTGCEFEIALMTEAPHLAPRIANKGAKLE
jgi:hypothetical protein